MKDFAKIFSTQGTNRTGVDKTVAVNSGSLFLDESSLAGGQQEDGNALNCECRMDRHNFSIFICDLGQEAVIHALLDLLEESRAMLSKAQQAQMDLKMFPIMTALNNLFEDTDEGEGDTLRERSKDSRIDQSLTDESFFNSSEEELNQTAEYLPKRVRRAVGSRRSAGMVSRGRERYLEPEDGVVDKAEDSSDRQALAIALGTDKGERQKDSSRNQVVALWLGMREELERSSANQAPDRELGIKDGEENSSETSKEFMGFGESGGY